MERTGEWLPPPPNMAEVASGAIGESWSIHYSKSASRRFQVEVEDLGPVSGNVEPKRGCDEGQRWCPQLATALWPTPAFARKNNKYSGSVFSRLVSWERHINKQ